MKKLPPKKNRFKKGQSGNPKGRPKGVLNRKTIIRKFLEAEEEVKNPINKEKEKLSQAEIMTLSMIKQARGGNVRAFELLFDSAFGKIPDVIHNEKKINLSDKEIKKRIKNLRKKINK